VEPAGLALDVATLGAWLRERLAPAKLPRVWHVAPGLPRNANGKLDRTAVREVLAARV
jgi:acyl-coenzyme A synthetase/AMP-(fatty) acid ligase